MNPIDGVPSANVWPGGKARGPNRNTAPFEEVFKREIRVSLIHCRTTLEPENQNVRAPRVQARKTLPNRVSFFTFLREPVTQPIPASKKKPQNEINR